MSQKSTTNAEYATKQDIIDILGVFKAEFKTELKTEIVLEFDKKLEMKIDEVLDVFNQYATRVENRFTEVDLKIEASQENVLNAVEEKLAKFRNDIIDHIDKMNQTTKILDEERSAHRYWLLRHDDHLEQHDRDIEFLRYDARAAKTKL